MHQYQEGMVNSEPGRLGETTDEMAFVQDLENGQHFGKGKKEERPCQLETETSLECSGTVGFVLNMQWMKGRGMRLKEA